MTMSGGILRMLLLAWCVCLLQGSQHASDATSTHNNQTAEHHSIHVASWRYDFVKNPMIFTEFLLSVAVFKILFHHAPDCISKNVPESCLLILLGILLGVVFLFDPEDSYGFLFFEERVFFLYLLPPIILEAAFSLRDRVFNENIGTILLYAVFGTVLNILLISFGLYALYLINFYDSIKVDLLDLLIFGSLIAAVDPVAVLAIFQEVGVNKMLYFMVFGESLLNDAVTVVVYNLMIEFKQMTTIVLGDILLGFASFLCVAFGAMLIGFAFGIFTAFLTKYTGHLRVVEPILLFGMAYLSYLTAEMFHFSGIISIICCGINQAQFASQNISSKSFISVHYFVKVASSVSESLIFIILGVNIVNHWEFFIEWDTSFTTFALFFCLLARFIVTFGLTHLVNMRTDGIRHISLQEQFIMSYGGLRGAISFSLAFMLDKSVVGARDAFLGATYFIIFFTVFFQGITMKPLVKLLQIQMMSKDTNYRLLTEFNHGIVKNMMGGIENIIGHKGYYYWTTISQWFSAHFIRPAVQKRTTVGGKRILEMFQEVEFEDKLQNRTAIPQQMEAMEKLDESDLTNKNADAVLDMQDKYRAAMEKNSKEGTVHAPTAGDYMAVKNLVMNPIMTSVDYSAFDKNLESEETLQHQRLQAMQHTMQLRQRRFSGPSPTTAHSHSQMKKSLPPTTSIQKRDMEVVLEPASALQLSSPQSASYSHRTDDIEMR